MDENAAQIRRDIEETRARMGETVEAIGYKADVPSRVGDAVRDRIDTVRGTVSNAVSSVTGAMSGASDTLADTASNVGGTLADSTTRAGQQVRDSAGNAKRAVSIAMENPLGVALGALALGFLGGLLIPVSDVEREKIGPVRDLVVDRAQTAAAEAITAGQAVLSDTVAAAKSSAQDHAQTIAQHAVAGTPLEAGQSQSASAPASQQPVLAQQEPA